MTKVLTKKELIACIGNELGESDWLTVNQSMIDSFADVTNDHQFIHVNKEKAALTPFGGTVAHGFLSLSMLSHFAGTGFGINVEGSVMSLNYGFDKIRFISPVKVDAQIRGRAKLISVDEKVAGRLLVKQSVVVDIKGESKPALLAEWLTMFVF